jgi:hypothetical protein
MILSFLPGIRVTSKARVQVGQIRGSRYSQPLTWSVMTDSITKDSQPSFAPTIVSQAAVEIKRVAWGSGDRSGGTRMTR